MSLTPSAKHGYAIWKDVEGLSSGSLQLSTSTLYDALERLLLQGLIARKEEESVKNSGRPRKKYRLTDLGKKTLVAETDRMRNLLDLAVPRLQENQM